MTQYLSKEALAEKLGFPSANYSNYLIFREADSRGLEVLKNSDRGQGLITDGRRKYTWSGGRTSWNTRLSQRVVRQKDVCSRLLNAYGVPAPENQVFESGDVKRAWAWAKPMGELVLKPVAGSHGDDVFVGG